MLKSELYDRVIPLQDSVVIEKYFIIINEDTRNNNQLLFPFY